MIISRLPNDPFSNQGQAEKNDIQTLSTLNCQNFLKIFELRKRFTEECLVLSDGIFFISELILRGTYTGLFTV